MTIIRLLLVLYATVASAAKLIDFIVLSGPDVHTVSIASNSKGDLIYGGSYRRNTSFDGFHLPGKNAYSYFLCVHQQWIKYDEDSTDKSHSSIKDIAIDNEDNIIAVGIFRSSVSFDGRFHKMNSTATLIFIVKYSSNGSHIWSQQYGNLWASAFSVAVADNNDVYLTAHCREVHPIGKNLGDSQQTFLIKYSSNGNFEWSRDLETTSEVHLAFVDGFIRPIPPASCVDHSGNLIETGVAEGTRLYANKTVAYIGRILYVRKKSGTGNILWSQSAITESDGTFTGVAVGNDNSIYAIGKYSKPFSWNSQGSVITFNKTKNYFNHVFLMRFDQSGELLWGTELLGESTLVSVLVQNNIVVVVGQFTHHIATARQSLDSDQHTRTFIAKWNPSATPSPSTASKDSQQLDTQDSETASQHSSFQFALADLAGIFIAVVIVGIFIWMRSEVPVSNTNRTAVPVHIGPRYDHIDLKVLVAEVIQFDPQYESLSDNLDIDNRWRKLGTQLGFNTSELDRMDRGRESPSKILLRKWGIRREATVMNLMNALLAVDNQTAADLVASFVQNKQKDTTENLELVHNKQE